uniref:Serine-threonine protein kinase plant-type n=1 Tax=Rhizophora mucronata TaxID=61149 RepID=A0A2P2KI86_RHIMU
MRFALMVSTIVLVVLLGTCHGCLEHERNALLQLFSYFANGSSYIPNTADCCHWRFPDFYEGALGKLPLSECALKPTCSCYHNIFVDCNDTAGRVTDLVLDFMIGDLYLNTSLFLPFKGLRNLELTGLEIVGFAENEGFHKLSKLKNLESLDLSCNRLSIVSSEGLCELRHLRSLSLSNNDLNGSLPWCLANMTFLQNLDLSYNQISGVPISRFENLESLDLRFNILNNSFLSSEGLSFAFDDIN